MKIETTIEMLDLYESFGDKRANEWLIIDKNERSA